MPAQYYLSLTNIFFVVISSLGIVTSTIQRLSVVYFALVRTGRLVSLAMRPLEGEFTFDNSETSDSLDKLASFVRNRWAGAKPDDVGFVFASESDAEEFRKLFDRPVTVFRLFLKRPS